MNCARHCQKVPDAIIWLQIIPDLFKCSQTFSDSTRRCQMPSDALRLAQMLRNTPAPSRHSQTPPTYHPTCNPSMSEFSSFETQPSPIFSQSPSFRLLSAAELAVGCLEPTLTCSFLGGHASKKCNTVDTSHVSSERTTECVMEQKR